MPTGTVTFVFTDIEGSTRLWQLHGADMDRSLAQHDRILRAAIIEGGGVVFSTGGDGLGAAFSRADQAVSAVVEAQRQLIAATWPGPVVRLSVTMAARLCDAANGTQVLISGSTAAVLAEQAGPGIELVDLGGHLLRDVVEPVRLLRVSGPGLGDDVRPPRTGSSGVGNLPSATTRLVGREAELAAVLQLLTEHPAVTVVGIGGIGKTSVAIEAGRARQATAPDGVWLARLEHARDGDDVVEVLLGVFGLEASGGGDTANTSSTPLPRSSHPSCRRVPT